MITKFIILLLCLLGFTEGKLVQVVSFFRHGARYHLSSYAGGNETKDYWGELTGVGMRQHHKLGDILRK